jgi:hypothetical protein
MNPPFLTLVNTAIACALLSSEGDIDFVGSAMN